MSLNNAARIMLLQLSHHQYKQLDEYPLSEVCEVFQTVCMYSQPHLFRPPLISHFRLVRHYSLDSSMLNTPRGHLSKFIIKLRMFLVELYGGKSQNSENVKKNWDNTAPCCVFVDLKVSFPG